MDRALEIVHHLKIVSRKCLFGPLQVLGKAQDISSTTGSAEFKVVIIGFDPLLPELVELGRDHGLEMVKDNIGQLLRFPNRDCTFPQRKSSTQASVCLMN